MHDRPDLVGMGHHPHSESSQWYWTGPRLGADLRPTEIRAEDARFAVRQPLGARRPPAAVSVIGLAILPAWSPSTFVTVGNLPRAAPRGTLGDRPVSRAGRVVNW
jgi:hypothetical protein